MDDNTQSSFGGCLSQISSNSQDSDLNRVSTNTFRKDRWLVQYFKFEGRDGRRCVTCRGCRESFVSRSHTRMKMHLAKCKATSDGGALAQEVYNDPKTTESITAALLARQLVVAGWSLRGVETKEFKQFVARLSDRWTIPSRHEFSAIYFPRISLQLHEKFKSALRLGGNNSVSIEFDHWRDAVGKSFLGVIATCNSGARYLLDLRDVSLRSHDAAVTVDVLMEVLKPLCKRSINSIVSDSAANCKKARQDIVKQPDYDHIIQHRCLAHFLNLIGSRLTVRHEAIAETVKRVAKIASTLSGSSYWTAYIKELDCSGVRTACPVRWFSTCTMLKALLDLKDVILDQILPDLDDDKRELIEALDWQLVSDIYELVEPLSACIGQVEKSDVSLGEGIRHILEYARKLFEDTVASNSGRDTTGLNDVRIAMRKAFLHYFNKNYLGSEEMELWLAAYALDRRYKLDYLTPKGIELCLRAISRIAVHTGATLEVVKATIFFEFEYYKCFKGEYKMTSERSITWWNERMNCGILSRVGQRLANLKASSANIERTFSAIKWIQGEYRLSMQPSTLLHMARIKIASKDEEHCWHEVWPDAQAEQPINIESVEESLVDLSMQSDASSITLDQHDAPNWIECEDVETKMNYQSFFRYFDFKLVNDCTAPEESASKVTNEDIRQCVKESIRKQNGTAETVIVDSYSQVQEIDDVISMDIQ